MDQALSVSNKMMTIYGCDSTTKKGNTHVLSSSVCCDQRFNSVRSTIIRKRKKGRNEIIVVSDNTRKKRKQKHSTHKIHQEDTPAIDGL
mmetsp:Transcript_4330/g.4411  ORF Transcript_4330/g.4411 Transcript_4330/m.4411 type:complete len:89 (-) Transcript_4330:339-605(-)